MSVHRLTPLPVREAAGRLLVAEAVLPLTVAALQAAGTADVPHEGLVLWLGRVVGTSTLVVSCHTPQVDAGPDFVFLPEVAVGAAARVARAHGLGVIAQVHSHPGHDTRHSDGDDQLVLMPFDGMFSLVVANYGRASLLPADGAGLHQYQRTGWVMISNADAMVVVGPELLTDSQ